MSYSMIVLAVIAVLFIVASVVLVHKLLSMRQEFAQVRLLSLSTAADSDVVGGVGISLLVASPASLSAVVNLLDSRYPLSEVVVALNCEKQPNLLQQLKLRYALVACSVEGCTVYRSRERVYRRLVVVTTREKVDSAALYDLAAHNALFDYLLRVPADYQLFTFAVGRIAEVLASELSGGVDVVTDGFSHSYIPPFRLDQANFLIFHQFLAEYGPQFYIFHRFKMQGSIIKL